MNKRDTHTLMVIDPCAKYDVTMSKQKKSPADTQTCQKPFKFYYEIKGECPIRIMNKHDTSSLGDTPKFKIW